MSLDYRPLSPRDDAAVAQLIRSSLKANRLDIPGTAYYDECLDHLSEYYRAEPRRDYYVLLEDGAVIGGVGLAAFDAFPDCCELQKLYLAESARGRGLGYDMTLYIENRAREMGFRQIYLETHTNLQQAIRLYEKCGYQEIERPACVVHSTMNKFYLKELTPCSGPVAVPLTAESALIQAAPVYDAEAAKRYIPGMRTIRELVNGIPKDDELTCFGAAAPSASALKRLSAELQRMLLEGHKVSLVMADLATQSGVAFHSTVPMCTQSTVKAIYAGAVLDCRPQAFLENGQYIRDAIVLSDNDAYENLRRIYGKVPLLKWCREAGVDDNFTDMPYPRNKNARDMFNMWTRLYCFLNDGSDIANAGRYLADSAESATKERLAGRYPVQTKAGWECGVDEDLEDFSLAVIPERFVDGDPMNDEVATNDTGIVYTENGPYLFVIYSDYPYPFGAPNQLYGLAEALCDVQRSYFAAR
ncbi:MAG: GNAT family N-acetyltransferase [Clostridia bacterium]|nr:GNAT family N-acetyltransferase [Clostridia bacterium]